LIRAAGAADENAITRKRNRQARSELSDWRGAPESKPMSSPEECRANAALCMEIANQATGNTSMQSAMYEMAESWLKVADQLELDGAIRLKSVCQTPASH
jgi:hypothetical protein